MLVKSDANHDAVISSIDNMPIQIIIGVLTRSASAILLIKQKL
jgi:hypothetical protein